jgi:hypothetical protein
MVKIGLFERACVAVLLLTSIRLANAQSATLPPGPMRSKIKAACLQCHNSKRITEQHLTRQQWSRKLDKMVKLGADVPNSQRAALLNYLTKNFGPEKTANTEEKGADGAK